MSEKKKRIAWHPAFCSAMELELRANKAQLLFAEEYPLSKEPLKIDLLVIEKQDGVILDNEIGGIFRRYNIMEYKNPDAALGLDEYFKVIAYVVLYKATEKKIGDRPLSELTLTLVRDTNPQKLLKQLAAGGASIENGKPGIYLVKNAPLNIPTQIIVSGELSPKNHSYLRVLTKKAKEQDVLALLEDIQHLTEQDDRQNAEAVIHVSASANDKLFKCLRGGKSMSEVLRDLIKEDIEAEIAKATEAANQKAEAEKKKAEAAKNSMMSSFVSTVKTLMEMCNFDFRHAAEAAKVPTELIPVIESML